MSVLYKIRNAEGKWCTGGRYCRFNSKGKVWTGLGGLKSFLSSNASCVDDEWEIVEFVAAVNETNLTVPRKAKTVVDRKKALETLAEQYGNTLAILYDRLDQKGEADRFRWVLIIPHTYQSNKDYAKFLDFKDGVKKTLKDCGISKSGYRECAESGRSEISFAFEDREVALMAKLAITAPGITAIDFVETKEFDTVRNLM